MCLDLRLSARSDRLIQTRPAPGFSASGIRACGVREVDDLATGPAGMRLMEPQEAHVILPGHHRCCSGDV